MAWVNTGASATLYDGARTYGTLYLQYDSDSVGVNRSCRLWWDYTQSGGSLNVTLRDITIGGVNRGNADVGTGDTAVWSGSLAGGQSYTFSWYCNWYSYGKISYASTSGTVPTGATNPDTPTVTINSIADTSASFDVAVASYGSPAAADGRYIEAAILAQSTYGSVYRYAIASNTSSATITVTNSSNGTLTIVPNTQYYYGAFASNTVLMVSTVAGQFITKPAYITGVTAVNDGQNNFTFTVAHASDGSAATVTTEYSYDESTWTAASDSFTLAIDSPKTVYVRRGNSSGYTPTFSVVVTPIALVHLYGSVNGARKEVKHLYGSVNGSRKKIKKLYASVNGARKLIFRDDS